MTQRPMPSPGLEPDRVEFTPAQRRRSLTAMMAGAFTAGIAFGLFQQQRQIVPARQVIGILTGQPAKLLFGLGNCAGVPFGQRPHGPGIENIGGLSEKLRDLLQDHVSLFEPTGGKVDGDLFQQHATTIAV